MPDGNVKDNQFFVSINFPEIKVPSAGIPIAAARETLFNTMVGLLHTLSAPDIGEIERQVIAGKLALLIYEAAATAAALQVDDQLIKSMGQFGSE